MSEYWLAGTITACFLAIIFRLSGALVLSIPKTRSIMRPFGWILSTIGAWIALSIAGVWVPIWIPLLLGVVITALAPLLPISNLRTAWDFVVIVGLCIATNSPLILTEAIIVGVIYLLFGKGADIFIKKLPQILTFSAVRISPSLASEIVIGKFFQIVSFTALAVPLILAAIWFFNNYSLRDALRTVDPTYLLYMGIVVPDAGKQFTLEGRHTVWLLEPETPPTAGAVVFHGAHSAGSHQPAAFAMQRGLLDAGYLVVSVDHPGYGKTATPTQEDTIQSWNPISTAKVAYEFIDTKLGADLDRVIIGHSLGVTDVLRLLGTGVRPDLAVLAGGAYPDPPKNENYWYQRFHTDRSLKWRISKEQYRELRTKYYDNRALVAQLSRDHSPILFLQFGIEWANVKAQREPLWDALTNPRKRIELPRTTHYINSFGIAGLVIADVRAAKNFSSIIERIRTSQFAE